MPTVKVSSMLAGVATKADYPVQPLMRHNKSTVPAPHQTVMPLKVNNMDRSKSLKVQFGDTYNNLDSSKVGINFDDIAEISNEEGMAFNNRLE